MSNKYPKIWFELVIDNECSGPIQVVCYRDIFPNGVDNFVSIMAGDTTSDSIFYVGSNKIFKSVKRTYTDCDFYKTKYDRYIQTGEIYEKGPGTIFDDNGIEYDGNDYYYPHDRKGLISLVPYYDNGKYYYDSTFMVTLGPDILLDEYQIVIGWVTSGQDYLDKVNARLRPSAGKKYPNLTIGKTGVGEIPRTPFIACSEKKSNCNKSHFLENPGNVEFI